KHKGTEGVIQIENPNLVKAKNIKAKEADLGKTTELSRREREEIEKQKSHERYMKLQEQGKTEQAKKDLERLALIRQQRADAAKKREEEKAGMPLDIRLLFLLSSASLPYISCSHIVFDLYLSHNF
uniref:Casein kinase substrate phosphoprotein PP28 domain-containing protein n=1 Tax=Aegilops tauschii subsp. strangulata TaxID=200361 RepID=A0A453FIW2_AEGTS